MYTIKILKTFFSELTTQSNTALINYQVLSIFIFRIKILEKKTKLDSYFQFRYSFNSFKRSQDTQYSQRFDCV
jgi:hypothetical protein